MIKGKEKNKVGRFAIVSGQKASQAGWRSALPALDTRQVEAKVKDVSLIENGFAIQEIKGAAKSTGLSVKEIIGTMGMSERTYERRRVSGKLTIDESDKLIRIARLCNMAMEIFGETAKVNEWLKKPNRVFAGRTPLEMAKTEVGGRQVENLLGAMQHGVFY